MDRPLYILPFRAIVGAVAGAILLGAIGGGSAALIILRRVLVSTPSGERVVERVERVSASSDDAMAVAASQLSERLGLLVDERGRVLGQAIPVTADGVFAAVGSPPRSRVRLRTGGGGEVPASIIRVYPEVSVFFLRAEISASVVDGGDLSLPDPGATVALVALNVTPALGARVRTLVMESHELNVRGVHDRGPGIGRAAILSGLIPSTFQGAPVLRADGLVVGVALVTESTTALLPLGLLGPLRDDTLRNPRETVVRVLGGVRGVWEIESDNVAVVFRVTEVSRDGPFAAAGLRVDDRIRAVDEQALSSPAPLLHPLLQAARQGNAVALRVERGDSTLIVTVQPSVQ